MLLALAEDVGSGELTDVEAVLDRCDVDQLAGPAQLVDGDLRDADEADLALVASSRMTPNCSSIGTPGSIRCSCQRSIVSSRRRRRLSSQSARSFSGRPSGCPPRRSPPLVAITNPVGVGMQRVGDQILRAAVRPRRVDQVDPEPHRLAQDLASGAGNLGPPGCPAAAWRRSRAGGRSARHRSRRYRPSGAEGEGFEPSVPGLPVQRFSRPPDSTTLAPLRERSGG